MSCFPSKGQKIGLSSNVRDRVGQATPQTPLWRPKPPVLRNPKIPIHNKTEVSFQVSLQHCNAQRRSASMTFSADSLG